MERPWVAQDFNPRRRACRRREVPGTSRRGQGTQSLADTLCPAAAYTAGSRRVSHLSRAGGTLVTKDLMASSSRFRVVLTDMSPYV